MIGRELALKDLNFVLEHNSSDKEALAERAKVYQKMNSQKFSTTERASLTKLEQSGKTGHQRKD